VLGQPSLLVLRRRHPGVREVLAQVPHRAAVERVAMVRPVQDAFGAVKLHPDARPGELLDVGADVAQQRLDLAPVDVAG